MRERTPLPPKLAVRRATVAVDVVALSPRDDSLAVLLVPARSGARERWSLPWDGPREGETIDVAATRITRSLLGSAPALVEQGGALSEGRHPAGVDLSLGVVALSPLDAAAAEPAVGAAWFPLDALPALAPRQRALVDLASRAVRQRMEQAPIAFHLLPEAFTLGELQGIYELLLGRRLHKASFRRALQASRLVQPTDVRRSEGRGRPAQLFVFAPKKRRGRQRGLRFDFA